MVLDARFIATAATMVVTLGAVCAALIYGRQVGYSPAYMLPALLPFAISGLVVLKLLKGGFSTPNSQPPL